MGPDQVAAHDLTTNEADSCARGATTAMLNVRREHGRAESDEADLVDRHAAVGGCRTGGGCRVVGALAEPTFILARPTAQAETQEKQRK